MAARGQNIKCKKKKPFTDRYTQSLVLYLASLGYFGLFKFAN